MELQVVFILLAVISTSSAQPYNVTCDPKPPWCFRGPLVNLQSLSSGGPTAIITSLADLQAVITACRDKRLDLLTAVQCVSTQFSCRGTNFTKGIPTADGMRNSYNFLCNAIRNGSGIDLPSCLTQANLQKMVSCVEIQTNSTSAPTTTPTADQFVRYMCMRNKVYFDCLKSSFANCASKERDTITCQTDLAWPMSCNRTVSQISPCKKQSLPAACSNSEECSTMARCRNKQCLCKTSYAGDGIICTKVSSASSFLPSVLPMLLISLTVYFG